MHVFLQNVVRLLYVRHKRMIQHVIALKVIQEILRQHVIHVRYLLNVYVISFLLSTCENCLLLVAPSTVAPITAGCDNNNECPSHTACRNRLCINPCAQDDPCASNAICRVANHQPICTCPDGFVGDPTISCNLRNLLS